MNGSKWMNALSWEISYLSNCPKKTIRLLLTCGVVESVKAVSEIYSPASGTVVEVNSELESNPSVINKSPTEDGWLFKMKLSNISELTKLMTPEKYKVYLETDA
ncbi:hypothetical protein P879_07317 [Paragonimus westermani]|uniref:Glycine cleavage system H protein n=1 Tax=Paragonimus westermani TaxID=34504 RepID=A0A8T0DLX2_9TREM|nr:hypothetical protein P879_07317 [Paragonimus westermani]